MEDKEYANQQYILRKKKQESSEHHSKVIFVWASCICGVFATIVLGSVYKLPLFICIPVGIISPFTYFFVGRICSVICEGLADFAEPIRYGEWSTEDEIMFAALWPLSFIPCVVYFTLYGCIRRLF